MTDRRDEPAARLEGCPAADPADRPEVKTLFTGWGGDPATCRKFAPTARNHTAAKLMSQVVLRVSEACKLDLAGIKWDLGRFGELHVRHGKGATRFGPTRADGSADQRR